MALLESGCLPMLLGKAKDRTGALVLNQGRIVTVDD